MRSILTALAITAMALPALAQAPQTEASAARTYQPEYSEVHRECRHR